MKMFDPGEFVILLAHCPEELDSYLKMGVTLIFSGHAHGGLMKLPFGLRLLAPGQGIFPRYTHDLIFEQESVMLVSAGLEAPGSEFSRSWSVWLCLRMNKRPNGT